MILDIQNLQKVKDDLRAGTIILPTLDEKIVVVTTIIKIKKDNIHKSKNTIVIMTNDTNSKKIKQSEMSLYLFEEWLLTIAENKSFVTHVEFI